MFVSDVSLSSLAAQQRERETNNADDSKSYADVITLRDAQTLLHTNYE